MRTRRAGIVSLVLTAFLAALLVALCLPEEAVFADDKNKKKKIKITVNATVKRGAAPLPVHFVAQIDAPEEMDEEIYKSGYEWVIMGRFVLTDPITGGDPTPVDMRGRIMSPGEYSARRDKHLVGKTKKRPPREPYKEGMEVEKSLEFDYTFDRAGEFFVQLRLKRGKYISNEVRIEVKGDTSYDPYRQQ